jgi:hypothetical protein
MVFATLFAWVAGKTATQRGRAIAIIVGYIGMIFCFSGVYYGLHRQDPQAFRFTSGASVLKADDTFQNYFGLLQDVHYRLFLLSLLDAYPKAGAHAIRKPDEWVDIDDKRRVKFTVISNTKTNITNETTITLPKILPAPFLYIKDGDKEVQFSSGPYSGGPYPQLLMLSHGTTEDMFKGHLSDLISFYEKERINLRSLIESSSLSDSSWDFLDFIYFSSVTMTTLGYGDIVPNKRITRLCVTAQSVCGVSYIAFALLLLWPRRIDKLRKED